MRAKAPWAQRAWAWSPFYTSVDQTNRHDFNFPPQSQRTPQASLETWYLDVIGRSFRENGCLCSAKYLGTADLGVETKNLRTRVRVKEGAKLQHRALSWGAGTGNGQRRGAGETAGGEPVTTTGDVSRGQAHGRCGAASAADTVSPTSSAVPRPKRPSEPSLARVTRCCVRVRLRWEDPEPHGWADAAGNGNCRGK